MVFFLCFCLLFFYLRKIRCQEKACVIEGQKREPKVRGRSKSLKENFFLSLNFFFFFMVFFFFFSSFSFAWEKKNAMRKCLIQRGKSGRVKAGTKSEKQSRSLKESSVPSLHFFSFLWFFFLCVFFYFFAWEKEDARRKCLKQKGRNRNQKWEGKTKAWR